MRKKIRNKILTSEMINVSSDTLQATYGEFEKTAE